MATDTTKIVDLIVPSKQELTNSVRKSKDLPKYWDRAYVTQKISEVKNHRHQMLLQFLWMTGVRISEALLVEKQDLDLENYTCTIKWQKSRRYQRRNIPLHPNLHGMLRMYSATMKFNERLFNFSRQRAWQIVKKCLNGHPHQLRHSFAVNWLRSGGNVIVLSRMLGHTKVQTTMEYLKIVPADQGKELLKINFGV